MKDMNEYNNLRHTEAIRNLLHTPLSSRKEDISLKIEYRVNYDKVISDFINFFRSVSFTGFMQFHSMGLYPKRTLLGLLCEAADLIQATRGYVGIVNTLFPNDEERDKYERIKKGVMTDVNTIILKLSKEDDIDVSIMYRQVCAYIEGEFTKALVITNLSKPVAIFLFREVLLDVTMMFNNAYIKR